MCALFGLEILQPGAVKGLSDEVRSSPLNRLAKERAESFRSDAKRLSTTVSLDMGGEVVPAQLSWSCVHWSTSHTEPGLNVLLTVCPVRTTLKHNNLMFLAALLGSWKSNKRSFPSCSGK